MDILTANDAKTHFREMLLKAQRAPVQINKNGKPVAVVMSAEEYENIEALKLQMLRARAVQARLLAFKLFKRIKQLSARR